MKVETDAVLVFFLKVRREGAWYSPYICSTEAKMAASNASWSPFGIFIEL